MEQLKMTERLTLGKLRKEMGSISGYCSCDSPILLSIIDDREYIIVGGNTSNEKIRVV